jgi:hypothetical protein
VFFLPLKIAIKLASLLFTALIAYLVLSAVQVVLASRASTDPGDLHRARAIAVDGPVARGSKLGTDLTARLSTAVSLVKADLAPRLIVVLVTPKGANPAPARAAATTYLERNGLSRAQITVSDSTSGTDGLRKIASELGGIDPKAIIVTDAIDVLWTKGAAASAGITPQIDPAAGSKVSLWQEIGPLARETSGVAAGRIIGDLRATWAAA